MTTPGPAERTVLHVVADRLQLLDLAGPVEVFRAANLLGASPAYRNLVASPDGGPVRSDSGVTVQPDTSIAGVLEELSRSGERLHTLVVAGGIGVYDLLGDPELRAGLVALSERAERVTSVCTGSLLLADAGLLRDRRATTHWASVEQLARLSPTTVVEEDPIYVRDGDVWTSAGVTTGIDLALALVEEDHGIDLAHQVAGWLVVFAQRPGGQSQFSARIAARPARRLRRGAAAGGSAAAAGDDRSHGRGGGPGGRAAQPRTPPPGRAPPPRHDPRPLPAALRPELSRPGPGSRDRAAARSDEPPTSDDHPRPTDTNPDPTRRPPCPRNSPSPSTRT
jgi:transcriptional regulator GlxA family with amidase domain